MMHKKTIESGANEAHDAPKPKCRLCEGTDLTSVFAADAVPVQDGRLWATSQEALDCPTGRIDLVFCNQCGHIFNTAFEIHKLRFDAAYDISLHHSPIYHAFVESVVDRLVRTYGIHNKSIMEIGCGKADFLRAMCRRGPNHAVGFDPTYVKQDDQNDLVVHREFFGPRHTDQQYDWVCCRSVLQYFTDPRAFLRLVRRVVKPGGGLYFEVPNSLETFRDGFVWNMVYEHANFYTPASLASLFRRSGYKVLRVSPCFDGQNLEIDAAPADGDVAITDPSEAGVSASEIAAFIRLRREETERWTRQIATWHSAGKTVALWGAGARAIDFLNTLALKPQEAPYIVDVSPKRQGLFLPKTAQEVHSPQSLLTFRPDVVLATNRTFAAEIRQQANDLGLSSEFHVL